MTFQRLAALNKEWMLIPPISATAAWLAKSFGMKLDSPTPESPPAPMQPEFEE